MIKAIYFDIYGVITYGNFSEIYSKVANRVGVSVQSVTDYHKEYLPDMLVGKVAPIDMFEKLGVNKALAISEFEEIWGKEIVDLMKIDERMLDLLVKLKQSYTLATLTNLTPERYEADMMLGLYKYFDYCVLSCKEGIKKPDPEFFLHSLALTGHKPEEVVFIDDQEKNTISAEKLGIRSIHYKNIETLVADLNALGVEA